MHRAPKPGNEYFCLSFELYDIAAPRTITERAKKKEEGLQVRRSTHHQSHLHAHRALLQIIWSNKDNGLCIVNSALEVVPFLRKKRQIMVIHEQGTM